MTNETTDSITKKADAAFRQAAAKVIEEARRYGTSIVVCEDGQIVERTWQEMERALMRKTDLGRGD
jgi:hypothetical protein